MSKAGGLPIYLLILDGFGSLLLVGAILGATGVDVGLPVLATIWPLLAILGIALIAPMIAWIIRKARQNRDNT
jgi:multisubunit Na+/H+ antiporter MnhG subunit